MSSPGRYSMMDQTYFNRDSNIELTDMDVTNAALMEETGLVKSKDKDSNSSQKSIVFSGDTRSGGKNPSTSEKTLKQG